MFSREVFKKNETVYSVGEPVATDTLWVVKSGLIGIEKPHPTAPKKGIIFYAVRSANPFGHESWGEKTHPYQATVLTRTATVERVILEPERKENPKVMAALLMDLDTRIRFSEEALSSSYLRQGYFPDNLMRILNHLADLNRTVPVSLDIIARFLGVGRVHTQRGVMRLVERGVIERTGRSTLQIK